ncbi:lysylphosphatidylglycerol synthase transmembrane domain-containing protein [Salinicola rhizosphaerae]|uniref:Flippase-like domain-containing protein n=1 Tax=Salinicola rhizosphaerae TaxID=1443141 RepID=A0ABQ3E5A4_9GAMM|nr:lysylphosphatidylglycerol synthase transmembrane domain-containing protein [Salinicola rhizosphaerae]GHB23742.1 hypothetical protein GCM10009038_23350 [Salinicola rhizosphaerae]
MSTALRVLCTLVLLGGLAWWLDVGELWAELRDLDPLWVTAALLISVPQVVISAWRWRMTAQRVGAPLPWIEAIREYYLATFLNQVLPGGVVGDAARAWRHGSRSGAAAAQASRGPALRAVIIERASGQIALVLVAIVTIACSTPLREGAARALGHAGDGWHLAISAAAMAAILTLLFLCRRRIARSLSTFTDDLRRALFDSRIWPLQLLSSLLVVGTYIAVFLCAAQALGVERRLDALLPLIPPLLMAMAIPLTVAGWGLREGAASLIWPLAGLPAQEGVTLSVTYGLLIFAGSLPGLIVLLASRPQTRAPTRQTTAAEPLAVMNREPSA